MNFYSSDETESNSIDDYNYNNDNEVNHDENGMDYNDDTESKSKLLQTSKYKSKLHRQDIRKIKNKEKRERREKTKVSYNSILLFLINFIVSGIRATKTNSKNY